MFDMVAELAAIHRDVAKTADGDAVSVTVSRTYDAEVEDVWDALTDPERLPRWFSRVTGDFAVGGTFEVDGNASGQILQCDRPTRLRVTFGSPDSIVDLRLDGAAERTTLDLVHTVPLAMAGSGAGALYPGPGWDGAFLGLAWHLAGEEFDPATVANSPEILEFNQGSIDGWAAAVEASGTATPEQLAEARAVAVQQYTVVPG